MKENRLIEIPFEDAEYSVFDFETTGTSARNDKVIEIGIVKIRKGKVTDTFSSFINPGRPVPYFITQMTGITNADVQDAPYFDEVYYKIKEFIGGSILTAHNLNFDHSFLKHECANYELEFPKNEAICTLRLARKLYPQLTSKSLGNLVKQLRIRHRDVHRGLGDAAAAAKILVRMFKLLREEHGVDTVSDLINFQRISFGPAPFTMIKKKLIDDLAKVPSDPGVYFFKNAKGEIIYIGKAKSLKERLRSYFLSNAMRKSKKIVRQSSSLGFTKTNSELTALIAETELVKIHDPRLNTLLKSYPQNYFVRLAMTKKFPAAEVTRSFDFDGNDYYGPYANRDTANSIKEIIDKTYQLRECTDKEFLKGKKCYLADIERCLAPCIQNNVEDSYKEELLRVNEFLCGHNQSAVDRLLNKMKELSSKQKYEEAAQVRDVVQTILDHLNRASILAEPINQANALIEIKGPVKNDYMLLIEGKIIFKNFFVGGEENFDDCLEDYFERAIQSFKEISGKDLERLKISLSWLVHNREKIKVHYLKEFKSSSDIAARMVFRQ